MSERVLVVALTDETPEGRAVVSTAFRDEYLTNPELMANVLDQLVAGFKEAFARSNQ